jgi:hypothetical protein
MNDINNTDSSMLAVSVDTEHIMTLTLTGVSSTTKHKKQIPIGAGGTWPIAPGSA